MYKFCVGILFVTSVCSLTVSCMYIIYLDGSDSHPSSHLHSFPVQVPFPTNLLPRLVFFCFVCVPLGLTRAFCVALVFQLSTGAWRALRRVYNWRKWSPFPSPSPHLACSWAVRCGVPWASMSLLVHQWLLHRTSANNCGCSKFMIPLAVLCVEDGTSLLFSLFPAPTFVLSPLLHCARSCINDLFSTAPSSWLLLSILRNTSLGDLPHLLCWGLRATPVAPRKAPSSCSRMLANH